MQVRHKASAGGLILRTLFFLHGAPGDGTLWQPVMNALEGGIGVSSMHSPTLRWFGPEAWNDDGADFGTEAHTLQLVELIGQARAAGASDIALVAWSYSCHVVLNTLVRHPRLIDRALLYEPGLPTYLTDPGDIDVFHRDAHAAFGPIAAQLPGQGARRAVEMLFEVSGGAGCFASLPVGRRERYLESARIMPLLMGGGQPPTDLKAQDLARISIPVTVAFGEQTRPLFEVASRAVARAIPRASLKTVADAHHMLPETAPDRFAALVRQWLQE